MSPDCICKKKSHTPKLIVLTGGPGAGKTAILEAAKKILCHHTETLPESAGIIFGGGFWRRKSKIARKAAQRAIFHVQRQLESIVLGESTAALGLCDRGSLDSLAYWPGTEDEFFAEFKTDKLTEFKRYAAVIHLRTPDGENGYNRDNPIRVETAEEARLIDQRIAEIWKGHPVYHPIASTPNFIDKLYVALGIIRQEISDCCVNPLLVDPKHQA